MKGNERASFVRVRPGNGAAGLIFAALCLFYAGYAGYPIFRTFISGYYPWYALENIAYNAAIATMLLLLAMVCGMKAKWRRFSILAGVVACAAAVVEHALLPAGSLRIMLAYSSLMTLYVWGAAAIMTFMSGRAVYKGTVNSVPLLCGALVFDCALVMDRLLPLHEPVVTGWFHELAGFVFVMTIGIAIGRELASGYMEAAVLRERESALDMMTSMQQSYYRVLEEKAAEVNASRHDMRHHYMVIGRFLKDHRYEDLETYLSESQAAIDESTPETYCSNSVVNVFANHYSCIAERNRIHFDIRCDAEGRFGIPDCDLCAILGNLFENAVDACLRIETGRRFIRVGITAVGSLLTIRFWNSTSSDVRQTENGFLSGKRESGAGYGLESVKAIADKHNGEAVFSWNKTEQVFDAKVLLQKPGTVTR